MGHARHDLCGYTDAEPFFRDAPYPTDGMRTVVSEVLARLAGDGSVPAVHPLETAFGGGKTHTLIALVHLALKGRYLAPLVGDLLVPASSTRPTPHPRRDGRGVDRKGKERELALLTTLTELYDSVWFRGSPGQVIRKEVHAGVGQVLGQIHQVLDQEGELVTAARVATQEPLLSLGKLLFQSEPTPSLEKLRETFKVNRRWPVQESGGVFDTLVREGVGRGYWCLFRLASETSIRPESLYGRDDSLPRDLDLSARTWALLSPEGARQRGWPGGAAVDPSKVEGWVRDLAAEQPVAYVSEPVQ